MKKLICVLMTIMMTIGLMACSAKEPVTVESVGQEAVNVEAKTNTVEASASEDSDNNTAAPEIQEFDNIYPEYILAETDTNITYLDKFGNETTITKNPEKVLTVYNSLLGLWYYMGGESLAKVKGSSNVPEEASDLIDLGSSYSLSLEAIVGLEPELVIISANVDTQVALAPILNEMGIETMIIDAKTNSFDRFMENAYLFAKVLGTEDSYIEKIEPILASIDTYIETAASVESGPRVASIFATSKSMTIETDIAQIGEIVKTLGGENIYTKEDIKAEGETRIPFSIEALVTQNPEVIMISTMGSVESAQEAMEAMITENPVWNEVDAVINDRVFYLPKDLSVYKPNQRYAEAFEMVAEKLYPELFPEK